MLTKAQFLFLKDFVKATKVNKKNDKMLTHYNREKIKFDDLARLLAKHPNLRPSEPYIKKEKRNSISDSFEIKRMVQYVEYCGLAECIASFDPDFYGISTLGIRAMEEYKLERTSKLRLPKIAILISCSSLILSIATFIFAYILTR